MTMDDLKRVDREWLLAREVAPVLGTDPHSIRVAARMAPERLGFPVCLVGSRVRIPKKPFIQYLEGKQ
jgi:hypothetical protein